MNVPPGQVEVRVACDAMCGGLARWLRLLGIDTTYTPDIADHHLVQHALIEQRVLISADGKLFERRVFATGELRGVRLPVGLKLLEQLRFVVRELRLSPAFPRCTSCNGLLEAVPRAEVAEQVPARTLIWTENFFRCSACGQIFWEGTHWQRIASVRGSITRA